MPLENSLTADRITSVPSSPATSPVRLFAQRHPAIVFVVLTYIITTLGWLPSILKGWTMMETPLPLSLLAGWGPTLAGFLLTGVLDGRTGVKALARRFVQKGVGMRWYAVATLSFVGLYGLAALLHLATGRPLDFSHLGVYEWVPSAFSHVNPLFLVLPFSLLVMVTGGAMNEEFGWRGFLLPRLLERYSPLTASLMLAPLWFAWHLPQTMLPGPTHTALLPFLGQLTLTTILMTWLHGNARGSMLIAVLFHTAGNATDKFFPAALDPTVGWLRFGWAAAIVLYWLMRGKRRPAQP